MIMGRRLGSVILYVIAALCLLCILAIPTTQNDAIMTVSLIGRFSASAAYGIVILYSSELFPTVSINNWTIKAIYNKMSNSTIFFKKTLQISILQDPNYILLSI